MKKLFVLSLSLALYSAAQGQNDLQPSPGDAPSAPAITHQALPTDDVALETCIVIAKCKDVTLKTFPGGGGGALLGTQDINNGSSSTCGLQLTYTLSKSVFDCAHDLGVHDVTLTVTDSRGTSASCVAKVTVVDRVIAKCKNVTLTLDNGRATLGALDLNDGSTTACGDAVFVSIKSENSVFTCKNLGINSVELTASAIQGNETDKCTSTVTVVGITTIGVQGNFNLTNIKSQAVEDKLAKWTAYKGWTWTTPAGGFEYGERFELVSSLFETPGSFIIGTAPYTYKWTLKGQTVGGNAPAYTGGTAGSLDPGKYDYHVNVTDANGCTGEAPFPVNIVDARCKKNKQEGDVVMCLPEVKNNKIKFKEDCVHPQAVEGILLAGSPNADPESSPKLGPCDKKNGNANGNNKTEAVEQQANASSLAKKIAAIEASSLTTLKAFPNPSRDGFTLDVVPPDTKHRFLLKVMDNTGRMVEEKVLGAAQRLQIGASYKPGMYYVELQQGTQKSTLKLIKQ